MRLTALPPDPPPPTKVDITVAGHQVIVEAPEPLDIVAAKALELFRATEDSARRSPIGFGTTGVHVERAEPEYCDELRVGSKP